MKEEKNKPIRKERKKSGRKKRREITKEEKWQAESKSEQQ